MRLHACVLMLLLAGPSVAVADDREADDVRYESPMAERALVPADDIGGYEAFHFAVTPTVGPSPDWKTLARNGDPEAMSNLGVMYDLGRDVARDPVRAVELYRAAADRGSVVAQNNLGVAYALGRGVERDQAQAIQWLGAAGKKGLVLAENTLGVLYLIAGDERSAAVWLSHAVARLSRGIAWGASLALRRSGFRDVPHLNLARLWEAKADDRGFDEWFWNAAVATAKGWPPVPAEPLAAYNWFDRACDAGLPAGAGKRDLAEAAERASTARWSLPLFSPSEQVLKEKKLIERISRSLCGSYASNNWKRLRKVLKRSAERFLGGREVPLERVYMYLKCYELTLGDVDLIRVTAENPMESNRAARDLIDYFVDELQDKFLLGKILMCRRDFGHGCVNLFEHIEVNKKTSVEFPEKVKALKRFERHLRRAVDNEHLKRHVGLCRTFLKEPEHCGN